MLPRKLSAIAKTRALALLLIATVSCSGLRHNSESCATATVVVYSTVESEIRFCRRSWKGQVGPDGFVGYVYSAYRAVLVGRGPDYIDPIVYDDPQTNQCVGTITISPDHAFAKIALQRIVKRAGDHQVRIPHPANGTYKIGIFRKAAPDEQQWHQRAKHGSS